MEFKMPTASLQEEQVVRLPPLRKVLHTQISNNKASRMLLKKFIHVLE